MSKPALIVLLTAFATLACGGDDRLTRQELAGRMNPEVHAVMTSFSAVFQTIGEAEEDEPVPAAAVRKLQAAATVERDAADTIAALRPPRDVEPEVERFVVAAREQAARLESMAGAT